MTGSLGLLDEEHQLRAGPVPPFELGRPLRDPHPLLPLKGVLGRGGVPARGFLESLLQKSECREKKNVYRYQSPPFFLKRPCNGEKNGQMNFPFFAVEAYVPGGVRNQAEKIRKNAFWPVPVQKFTFPGVDFRSGDLGRG